MKNVDINLLKQLCETYDSGCKIARALNIDYNTVKRLCLQNGLVLPKKYQMSEQAKTARKISNKGKKHNISEQGLKNISEAQKNRIITEEERKNKSNGQKARFKNPQKLAAHKKNLIGHKVTYESRKKRSQTLMNHIITDETKKKISNSVSFNYDKKMKKNISNPNDFNKDFIENHFIKNGILDNDGLCNHFSIENDYYSLRRLLTHFNIEIKTKDLQQEQKQFENFIRSIYNDEILTNKRGIIGKKEIDIFLPKLNIGIEFNGNFFHSTKYKEKKYHQNKSKECQKHNIELIHIWEDLWRNKNNLVKTILEARLGVINNINKIYARKCIIKTVPNDIYKDFCNRNHIQGYRKADICYGLYYNNELVQIASFGKVNGLGKAKTNNEKYDFEWIRGCPASNNVVIGGTSKLFKHFVKENNPKSVLCYADWNLFNGNGYKECDFELDGYTEPDKFYVEVNTMMRINRNPYKYQEFKTLVKSGKLIECYGAGSMRFVWKNPNNV